MRRKPAASHAHEILVDGRPVHCAARVRTWHETGLLFERCRRRKRTDLVCLHWTGAENPPANVFRNMRAVKPQPLSVHFMIDQAGDIYQMADANAFCAHAQGVNDRSVGIEIISRGDAGREVPTRDIERDTVIEVIHGKQVKYAAFTAEQVTSTLALVRALCEAYALPMRVPTADGEVLARAMVEDELERFRGVIGHLHTRAGKRDPGLRLLRLVHGHGDAGEGPLVA